MSYVQFKTGILLISAKQRIVQQYSLLKQLYEIGPGQWMKPDTSLRHWIFPDGRHFPQINRAFHCNVTLQVAILCGHPPFKLL